MSSYYPRSGASCSLGYKEVDKISYDIYVEMTESKLDHNIVGWIVLKENSQKRLFFHQCQFPCESGVLSLVLPSSIICNKVLLSNDITDKGQLIP